MKPTYAKMDANLVDSHVYARIKISILMNMIVPKLDYAGGVRVREGNAKSVKQLETVQMVAAEKY